MRKLEGNLPEVILAELLASPLKGTLVVVDDLLDCCRFVIRPFDLRGLDHPTSILSPRDPHPPLFCDAFQQKFLSYRSFNRGVSIWQSFGGRWMEHPEAMASSLIP